MTYQPQHQRQLNGTATAGEDCGVRALSMAIDFATRGGRIPTMTGLRERMGVKSGATNTADQKKGAESFDTPKETGGRDPIKYERKVGVPWSELVGPLKNGDKAVILSLSYKTINDKRPALSGDLRFMGNHSIMFLGSRTAVGGGVEVRSFDSLYDGRRTGIPKGPQWLPLWLVEDACEAFAGKGKATGGIVPTARLIPKPDAPDTPGDDDGDALPDREQSLEDALNEERAYLVRLMAVFNQRLHVIDGLLPIDTSHARDAVNEGTTGEEDS